MKNSSEYEVFSEGLKKILRADPKVVKAAMEQEKQEREERRKSGVKVRGRKSKASSLALLISFLLLGAYASGADSHPDRKPRDEYAKQFAADVEHEGRNVAAFAMRPGCPALCINHGNHDCLRIVMRSESVQTVDRFAVQELKPRLGQLRALGFVEVDILGLEASHNYPDGMVRVPIPPEVQR